MKENANNAEVLQKEMVKEETHKASCDGIAQELSETMPFEGYSYIKKEWIDQDDCIASVKLFVTLGQISLPANWNNTSSFEMMPEWGSVPLKRSWIVRLPTHYNGNEKYLFHYYYQVRYEDGRENATDTFTQLIVPHEFEYIDYSGECTHVKLHWSLDDWTYPQFTELEVDGIKWGDDFSVSQALYRSGDKSFENGRAALISRIAVPRVFKGIIWAPRGSKISYCFQMTTWTDEELQIRWDNNYGRDYKLNI